VSFSLPKFKPSFLKSIDAVFGRLAIKLVPSPSPRDIQGDVIRSILIIRPGGIGDAALLSLALYKLQASYPAARIDVLAERRNAGTFALVPGIDQVFLYDSPSGLIDVLRSSYDIVIDTEQWHRLSSIIARLTGAPVVVGFDTNDRRRMFTHTVPYSHEDYEADSFLHLVALLGTDTDRDETAQFLFPPDDARLIATKLLKSVETDKFVTIFPGASISERQWGVDRFRCVVKSLESHAVRAVVVGSADDRFLADAIVSGSRAVNLAGCTSISGTAAIISSSRLLISGDSGILHIGVGLGIPTVSLFGPGIASKWAPRGPRHRVLNMRIACSPCTRFGNTPPCPRNVNCLSGITPEEVVHAIMDLIEAVEN